MADTDSIVYNETENNESLASNVSGREAASREGLATAYIFLFAMALVPIFIGSLRSVVYHYNLKKKGEQAEERIRMREAAMFPIYASVALFSLYMIFKYLPKDLVNMVLNMIFFRYTCTIVHRYVYVLLQFVILFFSFVLFLFPPLFLSIPVGCTLLGGLFLYDIFWVFGTDVMVTVAKSFDAPIKLMVPLDLPENGMDASNFGMLGLGDIVIPGLFIALLCRFDFNHHPSKFRGYFYTSFIAYIIGLGTTIAIMHIFKAAQPALLYLVPTCVGLPLVLALIRGELGPLFA
ncbi:PREDICTED: minor histocompatibility antigen H13-like [Amphimedon queenslandica]|uniref:Peptidase A22B, signal peptide peptidase n=1 Tax=Amphimedon queenslandica TaxID=400682 RepID=A0AAN0JY47_AMPQE|nr:PREDICTED: minor histocompatibility antigen H13-like [Amphimedon queenslandica]|eukprot:XP_019861879.1 PREDICTED: minor histocompatibility antigen H13-like [Amphimedon queenslandica]